MRTRLLIAAIMCLAHAAGAQAPQQMTPEAQRQSLSVLASMDGEWRGTAWYMTPDGGRREVTQTERAGPMLGGTLKVVEGRGYDAQGQPVFNAFAVIAVDPRTRGLVMRAYNDGNVGDFPLTVDGDGYAWQIVAGPATISYRATIEDGSWHEVGTRKIGDQQPVTFFEMTLRRLGDTTWPTAGAVRPR